MHFSRIYGAENSSTLEVNLETFSVTSMGDFGCSVPLQRRGCSPRFAALNSIAYMVSLDRLISATGGQGGCVTVSRVSGPRAYLTK